MWLQVVPSAIYCRYPVIILHFTLISSYILRYFGFTFYATLRYEIPFRAHGGPPTNLGPDNVSGEARAVYRHGTFPLTFVNRSAEDQPVFCRPAATPETVHRIR